MATYYIADTHFGHANVIRFDRRPFSCLEEMEEILVMNWNAVVRHNDTVYILGDFCWNGPEEWRRLLLRLRGKKILIRGNHDLKSIPEPVMKQLHGVYDYKEIHDNGRKVILSHYPMPFYRHSFNAKFYMLCGHVHNTIENDYLEKWTRELKHDFAEGGTAHAYNCGQVYNVGCMMPYMNYTPRTLDEIVRGHAAWVLKEPNAETIAAIKEAERMENNLSVGKNYPTVDELFEELNQDDEIDKK